MPTTDWTSNSSTKDKVITRKLKARMDWVAYLDCTLDCFTYFIHLKCVSSYLAAGIWFRFPNRSLFVRLIVRNRDVCHPCCPKTVSGYDIHFASCVICWYHEIFNGATAWQWAPMASNLHDTKRQTLFKTSFQTSLVARYNCCYIELVSFLECRPTDESHVQLPSGYLGGGFHLE